MDEILSFFSTLYATRVSSPFICDGLNWRGLSLQDSNLLEAPFTEKEIREAVFDMGCLKSPGPDGMTGEFYKKSWNILKSDLVRVFQDFFKNGVINICSETYICLIPKKKEACRVSDFRPISLITSLYKIISKVLASRLKKVLPSIINDSQMAFVEGRQILDAILTASEAVDEWSLRGRKGVLLKLDLEKAYDKVDWSFLDMIMKLKGFGKRWRKWIWGCLSTLITQ